MDSLPSSSERVFSLQDLADHVAERALWCWYRADDYLSQWPTTAAHDFDQWAAAIRDDGLRERLALRDDALGRALKPGAWHETLEDHAKRRDTFVAEIERREQMERRRAALFRRISGRMRDFIAANDCAVQGVGPTGTAVEVPRAILPQLEMDLQRNVLRTRGAGIKWEAVVIVVPTMQRTDAPPSGRTAPPVDRLHSRRRAHALLREIYGEDCLTNGSLKNVPAPAVQAALASRDLHMGIDNVRRVLGRK
jgi:hypothetical protein